VAGSITGPMAKLGRAKVHYEALKEILAGPAGHGFYSYPVTAQVHREGLEYRFHVGHVPSFEAEGERVSLILGDFLFNLRATLDQIVYELHVRHFRGAVPDDVGDKTQFPIFSTPRIDSKGRRIPTSKWQSIGNLSKRQQAAIEWLQPYNRREDKLSYARIALEILANLNNIDKHRRLHITQVATAAVPGPPRFPPSTGFRQEIFWGPLISDAEILRWTFTDPPADIAKHVNMRHEVAVGVRIEEPGEPLEILVLAEFLLNRIGDEIVPRLATALR
jgi:hypothetical protein